jgi:hypothetical protein
MKNEMKRKEQERHYKLRESSLRNIQNPTPFQNFEITKNILREKIKFKKCIYSYHKTLMNNVVDAGDCVEGTFDKYFFCKLKNYIKYIVLIDVLMYNFFLILETSKIVIKSKSKITKITNKFKNTHFYFHKILIFIFIFYLKLIGTKRNSLKSLKINFTDLTKDERNFMEVSCSNKDNFTKTMLPTINSKFTNNANSHYHYTIYDKFNSSNRNEENKGITNYNNKTGMLRSAFNSQNETDKMFQINSKYGENLELNILEETQNHDLSSLEGKSDCKNSKFESGKKLNFELENSNERKGKDLNSEINYENNNDKANKENNNSICNKNNKNDKENKINIIEQEKLDNSILNSNKRNNINSKRHSIVSLILKDKSKLKNKASKLSALSKNYNGDLNNNVNNNNDISGLLELNINLQNLPTNQDVEKCKTFQRQNTTENNLKNKWSNEKLFDNENFKEFDESAEIENNKKNIKGNQQKETNNNANSSDCSNYLNKNETIKYYTSKKANKTNDRSLGTNKSSSIQKDNSCIKFKKSEIRIFPNEPTFYGFMEIAHLNKINNKKLIDEKKLEYVNATKTTLNYLQSAFKTSSQKDPKKPLFGLNRNTKTSIHDNYFKANNSVSKIISDNNYKSKINYNNKNNKENSFKSNDNYIGIGQLQEEIIYNGKTKLENLKNHLRKNSQKEILVKEMLDETINDKVEIFKSILNSRDYIPQSELDVGNNPKFLRPIKYFNFKNKNKKGLLADYLYNSDRNNLNGSENFEIKNGYSFSPRDGKNMFRNKDKKNLIL